MSGPNRTFSFSQGDEHLSRSGGSVISPLHSPANNTYHDDLSPISEIASSIHDSDMRDAHGLGYTQSMRTTSTVTPGMDNFGLSAVGGGISGIALGVANTHDRLSGVDALRAADSGAFVGSAERDYYTTGSENPYIPPSPETGGLGNPGANLGAQDLYGSEVHLGAAAAPTGQLSRENISPHLPPSTSLQDGPYQRQSMYTSSRDSPLYINPEEIEDDGDDGFFPDPEPRSRLSLGRSRQRGSLSAAAAGGAAAGGFFSFLGLGKRKLDTSPATNPSYGPVAGAALEAGEKRRSTSYQSNGAKKRGWFVGIGLGLVIVAAIIGGAVGGILGNKSHSSSNDGTGSTGSASQDDTDLDKNSAEIKSLMNNPNLHKVFPGMDYTPWGVQYPLCLKYPPLQSNVTKDMAVLSQLTNNVRLYGTDCNQTEMVLHAIEKLDLTDMKIWLGVWLDTNTTTNDRQLNQLYKIVDSVNDTSIFNGAIIGNEALYRAGPDVATAEKNVINYMKDVKANFTQRNLDLPVATSDLGDNWNAELVDVADLVMSNVHPFFSGVNADIAASWTWTFWQQHDVVLTKGTNKTQVIAETGWPSAGGNDCGTDNTCTNSTVGSVAGIEEMNRFMSDWVCQALENGTEYFWFEAFDEPWKVIYNTPGKDWEDKWGLMDAARNLKPGLKIPDCGGKTA
ncbi:hypothetical protein ASPZODRAFT_62259 [Penicilliopsis zonata CBS 506.65]|uniref:glucan endo-1,3-beta-D-glucosidase n=1 Tax=Penicilliopsis zonata CBS 506.65 TaxID=1073090 RepID=A0A1L9SM83_9EURO|nr:hypothetical protein ASPZODRAFT_62259 [Penicilliopsis zonata CBS 506.65]OJJ48359.1 hypothetical protein ASPZODRAFT_62259 [Penicilliopsis zonata CBS 506.65]